jgi:hypothetical protein
MRLVSMQEACVYISVSPIHHVRLVPTNGDRNHL